MEIVIDLNSFLQEFSGPPWVSAWKFFINGGWTIFIFFAIFAAFLANDARLKRRYAGQWKWILLAIDIPKENEQTPKAVEHIFSHLAGIQTTPTFYQKYFQGKLQEHFSLELISLEGHIQFLIRTEENYRDLVEAAIFAQYPEAEIAEVEDYAQSAPNVFPSDEYEMFGTEFKLFNHEAYPIRLYSQFEHALDQTYKDPMAALLEILSKFKKGEQVWLQFVITPVTGAWKAAGDALVRRLIGKTGGASGGIFNTIFGETINWWNEVTAQIFGFVKGGATAASSELPSLMLHLSPGEKKIVEAIEQKISKIGFRTKFRFIYLAKKEVYNPARGADAVIGAILQFNTQDMNGFAPFKPLLTKTHYLLGNRRLQYRRTKLMRHYKKRSNFEGIARKGHVLNIEELASVWHFPMLQVKAPWLQKTGAKKGEPPDTLPIFDEIEDEAIKKARPQIEIAAPPDNLPVI